MRAGEVGLVGGAIGAKQNQVATSQVGTVVKLAG